MSRNPDDSGIAEQSRDVLDSTRRVPQKDYHTRPPALNVASVRGLFSLMLPLHNPSAAEARRAVRGPIVTREFRTATGMHQREGPTSLQTGGSKGVFRILLKSIPRQTIGSYARDQVNRDNHASRRATLQLEIQDRSGTTRQPRRVRCDIKNTQDSPSNRRRHLPRTCSVT